MALETPFGDDSALIRLLTNWKHPQLGHGLLATLQLRPMDSALATAKEAAALNLLEAISWTGFPQLGCWHSKELRPGEDGLAFTLFMPNALCQPGLATHIASWFLQRAHWVREVCFPDLEDATMSDVLTRRLESLT